MVSIEVLGASRCPPARDEVGSRRFQEMQTLCGQMDAKNRKSLAYVALLTGFLCCHSLCVLQHVCIFQVPPYYILDRWTRYG